MSTEEEEPIPKYTNETIKIVSRLEWGAADPSTPLEPSKLPFDSTVLSWSTESPVSSSSNDCKMKMRVLQADHMGKGEPDICYNFCICGDGMIYEGRGWNANPSKQLEYPESYGRSMVVGVFGERRKEFDGSWYGTPPIMLPALKLVKDAVDAKYLDNMHELYEDHDTVIRTLKAQPESIHDFESP